MTTQKQLNNNIQQLSRKSRSLNLRQIDLKQRKTSTGKGELTEIKMKVVTLTKWRSRKESTHRDLTEEVKEVKEGALEVESTEVVEVEKVEVENITKTGKRVVQLKKVENTKKVMLSKEVTEEEVATEAGENIEVEEVVNIEEEENIEEEVDQEAQEEESTEEEVVIREVEVMAEDIALVQLKTVLWSMWKVVKVNSQSI
jgi:hypothetical protein